MKLTCSLGTIICNDETEVEKNIRKCESKQFDEILLNFDEEYPNLVILTNKELACVQFSETNAKAYCSASDGNPDEITKFYTGGMLSEIPNNMVISLALAIECAKYFFSSMSRSPQINWNEL